MADVDDTTEGGLLMAGSSKEKPTLGTVSLALQPSLNSSYSQSVCSGNLVWFEAVLCCADLGCAVLLSIRLSGACFNWVVYCDHAAAYYVDLATALGLLMASDSQHGYLQSCGRLCIL